MLKPCFVKNVSKANNKQKDILDPCSHDEWLAGNAVLNNNADKSRDNLAPY